MMKPKLFFLLLGMLCASSASLYALDFTRADYIFKSGGDLSICKTALDSLHNLAASDREKAEVLWRLSRLSLLEEDFANGKKYAEQAIKCDPKNPCGYMWRCACVGIECKQKSLVEQAKAVPAMLNDLEMIIDKLGCTDYSEAWQTKAEIYYRHPFKSNDSAIEYARKAVATIPSDEIRLTTRAFLAKLLAERDWSASKRGSISDKAEAKAILEEGIRLYRSTSSRTKVDEVGYREAVKVLQSL